VELFFLQELDQNIVLQMSLPMRTCPSLGMNFGMSYMGYFTLSVHFGKITIIKSGC